MVSEYKKKQIRDDHCVPSPGMSLYQVIKLLKQNDEQIKSVVLVYNDKVEEFEEKI